MHKIKPFDIKSAFLYNLIMRVLLTAIILMMTSSVFASEELSRQATAFYSDNNRTKAMDLILQINENERTAQDWLILGNLLDDNGETDNAVFMYQKALSTDKRYYKAYYNLANIYAEEGQYKLALKNYKKAVFYNRENPYLFYNMACTYLKTGNASKAKTNLIKAISLKSDVPDFHYNLAYAYKKLNKPDLAQTYLDNFKKLTALNP